MVTHGSYALAQAGLVHKQLIHKKAFDKKWLLIITVSISANVLFAFMVDFESGRAPPAMRGDLLSINLMPSLAKPVVTAQTFSAATNATVNSRPASDLVARSASLPANTVTQSRGQRFHTSNASKNREGDDNTRDIDSPQLNTQQNKTLSMAQLVPGHSNGRDSNRESNSHENLPATETTRTEQQNVSDNSTTVQVAKHTAGALSIEAAIEAAAVVTRAGFSTRDNTRDSTTAAQYLYRQAPRYPPRARTLGQQGMVVLHAEVLPSGFSQNLEVAVSSGHRLLDGAALAAVRKWQFVPAYAQGQPVAHWVSVPVRFTLQ